MAALLRQGARRIGGSVLQRTQAALTSPAVAEERRLLVPRRMYSAGEPAPLTPRQKYLREKYGHLKPHQICWEFIKFFPGGKILGLFAMGSAAVAFASASRELKLEREEAKKKAEEKREQSASTKLKRLEAEKKRERSASTELKQQLAY